MKLLKVGVTGGIGCGKSTVCRIFQALGVPVYFADERARELSVQHPVIIQGYKSLVGKAAYDANGKLNRSFVAGKIFADKSLLKKINQLVHPFVQNDFLAWARDSGAPVVIEEAAVLCESGGHQHLDRVIVVQAPEEIRIQRVVKRDGVSSTMVKERMAGQWNDARRMPFADYVIHNDDRRLVVPQVLSIYEALRVIM